MKAHETIWIVTEVWRGIPASVHAFRDSETALAYEQQVRGRINLLEDETGVFGVQLETASDDQS